MFVLKGKEISRPVVDSGCDAINELHRSIFDCEVAVKKLMDRLIGCGVYPEGGSAEFPKAGRKLGRVGRVGRVGQVPQNTVYVSV